MVSRRQETSGLSEGQCGYSPLVKESSEGGQVGGAWLCKTLYGGRPQPWWSLLGNFKNCRCLVLTPNWFILNITGRGLSTHQFVKLSRWFKYAARIYKLAQPPATVSPVAHQFSNTIPWHPLFLLYTNHFPASSFLFIGFRQLKKFNSKTINK